MQPSRRSLVLGLALVAGAFAYLMAFPATLDLADESFALYESKRLWEGDAPYRDFFDFIMPGTFYFYAAAYALAGVNITAARTSTALLNAASCGLTWVLARHVASPAIAAVAAVAFIVGMVPAWNHAGHHWVATFLTLAVAAVTLSRRWRDSERMRPAVAGALGGALICSHQGRGAWVVLWLVIVLPLIAWSRQGRAPWRRVGRESCWAAVGALATAAPMLGWAVWRASLREVLYATYTFVVGQYGGTNVGLVRWGDSLHALLGHGDPTIWPWFVRTIPALLAVEAMSLVGIVLRDGLRGHVVRAALLLLAGCTAGSVLYFPDHIHVATVAPLSLVVIAGLAQRAGGAIAACRDARLTAAWHLGGVLVILIVVATGVRSLVEARARAPVLLETAFGTLATTEQVGAVLRDVRESIVPDGAGRPRLFTYPSDAWLYLTLPADNPTPYCLMMPRYSTPQQYDDAIARLRSDPSAYVILRWATTQPDDPVLAMLKRDYRVVRNLGQPHPKTGFRERILYAPRRRSGESAPVD